MGRGPIRPLPTAGHGYRSPRSADARGYNRPSRPQQGHSRNWAGLALRPSATLVSTDQTDLAMLPVKRHEVGREFPICTVSFETRSKFARPPGLAPSLAALPGTARDEPTRVRVMCGKKA